MGGRNVEMMKQILISELNFVVKYFILDLNGNRRNLNFFGFKPFKLENGVNEVDDTIAC